MGDLETKGQSKIVNHVKIEEIKKKTSYLSLKKRKREEKRERKSNVNFTYGSNVYIRYNLFELSF
jgi:hypothetical protein